MTEYPKTKTSSEKSLQSKTGNATQINGEKSLSSDDDNNKDKTSTKEPIINGTENINFVNGDPKNISDCDISSSDNTKLVSNGINSDSDDAKSNKSDESNDAILTPELPVKVLDCKSVGSKKKDKKKSNSLDKNRDIEKKMSRVENNAVDNKDDEIVKKSENEYEKTKDDTNKVVNGDKDRESSPSEDGDEKKRDTEVVFIQDMGFTVKIVSPRAEPLDIQVNFEFINSHLKLYVHNFCIQLNA